MNDLKGERKLPLLFQAWKAKLACSLGVVGYYIVGYFGLNRFPFETYHDVPSVPLFDDLPVIPWTILVYNSVFVLGTLGIWLLPHERAVGKYFLSVFLSYSLNYLLFWLLPTEIQRAPVPETNGLWAWAFGLTRGLDAPHTCFPSLHITNCTVAVIGLWRTRYAPWFLAWTIAISLSTLTTDQHMFLDLPAGALVGMAGSAGASWLLRALRPREQGR